MNIFKKKIILKEKYLKIFIAFIYGLSAFLIGFMMGIFNQLNNLPKSGLEFALSNQMTIITFIIAVLIAILMFSYSLLSARFFENKIKDELKSIHDKLDNLTDMGKTV